MLKGVAKEMFRDEYGFLVKALFEQAGQEFIVEPYKEILSADLDEIIFN